LTPGLRAEAKGLQLSVIRSDDVPAFVVTDESRLRQVLVNLLGNAVNYTDTGSVTLHVSTRTIDDGGATELRVEVADSGRGIAPEDMSRLFHYFERITPEDETQTGTGLGLAISREFVRLLGGEIAAESTLGEGSVFSFWIPVEVTTADAVAHHGEQRQVQGISSGQREYRVLIADDVADSRELLADILRPVGFGVRFATNGREALEAYSEWQPDAILMDMRMPVMDGYEATRKIREAEGEDRRVQIAAVTASAFSDMRRRAREAGVDAFIAKPVRTSEVLGTVERLLGVRYDYREERTSVRETVDAHGLSAISDLPGDLTSRLGKAAAAADFDAVLTLADEVESLDPACATALRAAAKRFDAESILGAIPVHAG
jgi:CheY-like chemotaxis protein